MGIVYDMRRKGSARADLPVLAARRLAMSGGPEEEFFFLSFDTKQGGLVSWSRGTAEAARPFDLGQVAGMTPLDETVHSGVRRIRESTGQKKALVVISEAPEKDIRLALGAQDLTSLSGFQVYVIQRDPSRSAPTSAESRIPGATYGINDLTEVEYYLGLVYAELQNQYVIGYVPSRGSCDGRWRRISIRLNPPKGMPSLRVKAPQGYSASPARF
jgi:Ca-activated chloride channel family protein